MASGIDQKQAAAGELEFNQCRQRAVIGRSKHACLWFLCGLFSDVGCQRLPLELTLDFSDFTQLVTAGETELWAASPTEV